MKAEKFAENLHSNKLLSSNSLGAKLYFPHPRTAALAVLMETRVHQHSKDPTERHPMSTAHRQELQVLAYLSCSFVSSALLPSHINLDSDFLISPGSSRKSGDVRNDWRWANVTSIHKKGWKSDPSKYSLSA